MAIGNDVQLTIGAKDRTKAALKSVRAGINKTAKAGALIGVGTIVALAKVVNSTRQTQDEIGKLSDRYNISTEALAAFGRQADLTGTSQETINKSIAKMTKNIGDAAAGFGMAMPIFKQMNINVDELKRLGAEEQYLLISDSIKSMGTAAEQASAAQGIFGRSGGDMLNMIREGKEGFNAAKQEVMDYGIALSRIETKQIEDMNDEITRAGGAMEGVANQLTVQLSPFIRQIAIDFQNSAKAGKGFGGTIETVINNTIKGIGFMLDAWRGLEFVWVGLQVVFAQVGEFILEEINTIMTGWNDLKALFGFEPDPDAGIAGILNQAQMNTAELKNELAELVSQEMPSDTITQWAEEAKIAALEAAEAVKSVTVATGGDVIKESVKESKERIKIEKDTAKHIGKIKKDNVSLAIGLLKTLGGSHKAFAYAALVVEKGIAIAETFVSTQAAAMKAMTIDPTGVMAARVELMGGIKMGLIAATGLAQAGSIGGGGAGSVGSPVEVATTTADIQAAQATTATPAPTQVNLSIPGGIHDHNALIELAENLSELAGDGLDVRATVV